MTLIPGAVSPTPIAMPCGDEAKWASPLDLGELALHIAHVKERNISAREKGDRLEALVCWLFSYIPGVRAERKNIYSEDGSQELDVMFSNDRRSDGFPAFDDLFFAECKNWSVAVDSSTVAWMDWKLRLGGVTHGLLIATNGVTGRVGRREDAGAIILAANRSESPRKIYVITLDEMAALTSVADLVAMLKDKMMDLAAGRPLP